MDVQFQRVQPGDVITSDLFNLLLAEFAKLRDRVTVLEGSSAVGDVGIQALAPASGVVRPGDTLSVFGFGFGVSLGVCRVSIDEVPIPDIKAGSSDKQLVFDIPAALEDTIPAAGRVAVLKVSGFRGSAHTSLRLQPSRLVVRGAVEFAFVDVTPAPPAPIARNAPATFQYSARSTVAGTASLQLKPVFSGVADPGVWTPQASFTDAAGAALPGGRLTLAANEGGRLFKLTLAKVPQTADTSFQVAVSGATDDGLVTGLSGARPFPIGAAQEVQDPDIVLSIASVTGGGGKLDGTGALVLEKGKTTVVTLRAFLKQGTVAHTASAPAFDGTGGWTTTTLQQTIPGSAVAPPSGIERFLEFDVTTAANAVPSAVVTLRVKRTGAIISSTYPLPLKTPTA